MRISDQHIICLTNSPSHRLDHEESNRQDQPRYQSEQSVNQINYKGATTSRVVGKAAPWELRQDIRDWDARNLRIETQVAEVQRASHG